MDSWRTSSFIILQNHNEQMSLYIVIKSLIISLG